LKVKKIKAYYFRLFLCVPALLSSGAKNALTLNDCPGRDVDGRYRMSSSLHAANERTEAPLICHMT
jgi:hypothetical protein